MTHSIQTYVRIILFVDGTHGLCDNFIILCSSLYRVRQKDPTKETLISLKQVNIMLANVWRNLANSTTYISVYLSNGKYH